MNKSTVVVPHADSAPGACALDALLRAVAEGRAAMPLFMGRGPTNGESPTFVVDRSHFKLTRKSLILEGMRGIPVQWPGLSEDCFLRYLVLGFERQRLVIRVKAPLRHPLRLREEAKTPKDTKPEKKVSAGLGAKNAIHVARKTPARVSSGGLPSLGKRK